MRLVRGYITALTDLLLDIESYRNKQLPVSIGG